MIGAVIGGLVGQDHAQAGFDAQKAAISQMIAKLDSVGMPPDQSAAVILDQFKQAGVLTPQLEQQVHDSTSQFQNIKVNQQARDTQIQALQQMKQYGKAGLNADERAQMRSSQLAVQQQNEANQQSIQQQMQSRGMQGSGSELAARLMASQGSANQASVNADSVSSMAQQRALQALMAQSNMGGQLAQQQFGEDAAKAQAGDEMSRFNTQNQMAIGQRNVAVGNQAQAANLANLQSINNTNVGQNNQEKYNQLQRQRQFWTDKLNYAQAYANPLQQYGEVGKEAEMSKAKMAAGLGKGFDDTAMSIFSTIYGKGPKKVSGSEVGENQGQGPTNQAAASGGNGMVGVPYANSQYGR